MKLFHTAALCLLAGAKIGGALGIVNSYTNQFCFTKYTSEAPATVLTTTHTKTVPFYTVSTYHPSDVVTIVPRPTVTTSTFVSQVTSTQFEGATRTITNNVVSTGTVVKTTTLFEAAEAGITAAAFIPTNPAVIVVEEAEEDAEPKKDLKVRRGIFNRGKPKTHATSTSNVYVSSNFHATYYYNYNGHITIIENNNGYKTTTYTSQGHPATIIGPTPPPPVVRSPDPTPQPLPDVPQVEARETPKKDFKVHRGFWPWPKLPTTYSSGTTQYHATTVFVKNGKYTTSYITNNKDVTTIYRTAGGTSQTITTTLAKRDEARTPNPTPKALPTIPQVEARETSQVTSKTTIVNVHTTVLINVADPKTTFKSTSTKNFVTTKVNHHRARSAIPAEPQARATHINHPHGQLQDTHFQVQPKKSWFDFWWGTARYPSIVYCQELVKVVNTQVVVLPGREPSTTTLPHGTSTSIVLSTRKHVVTEAPVTTKTVVHHEYVTSTSTEKALATNVVGHGYCGQG